MGHCPRMVGQIARDFSASFADKIGPDHVGTMRTFPPMMGPQPRRGRSIDLKTSLIIRIAIVAISCFLLVTAAVLWNADRDARGQAATTADLVARQLSFQVLRINTGLDLSKRYPDWDVLVANNPARGQCVRLENERGEIVRSDCVGSLAQKDEAPGWFFTVWSFLSPEEPATSPVSYKGKGYGTVVVSSDPRVAASRAWNEMKHLLILTALTILALSVLVYVAITRALAPTKDVIAGLNTLSTGAFSHRLPGFKLSELQRIAEVTNELAQKIETTLSERAELSRRLMNAQEEERRRLARELHDAFGQNLTAIAALAASIEKTADEGCPELSTEAHSLSQISMGMLQSLRATLLDLRPADFDKFGLTESLKQLVDVWRASARSKTRFELNIPRELAPLSDTAAIHIFRIAQEGLTNAAKHADAKTVRLSVEPVFMVQPKNEHATGISLTIEDDGKGRRPNGTAGANGMGLVNMQERVAALGGTIALDDRPGSGFAVRIIVPVPAAEAAKNERPS
jgi:two-component system, NarL family, sensor histidine kinase UhpB